MKRTLYVECLRKIFLSFFLILIVCFSFGQKTYPLLNFPNKSITYPNSIANLTLWLNADSGIIDLNTDGFIEEWQDQSGQLNNSTQSILGTQPRKILNQLNGHSVINFDGVDDNLIGTTINQFNNKSFTFFIVAKGYPQTGVLASYFEISGYDNGLCIGRHMNDGTAFNYFCGAVDLNGFQDMNMGFEPQIFIARKNMSNSVELKTNTSSNIVSSNSTLTGTFLNGNYHIGYATNWNYLNADIAEIILYDTILNANQEYQVYQYLALKYGARTAMFWPDSISDYSFCNQTLIAGTDYQNYQWSTGENTQSISVDTSGWFYVDVTDTIFDYVSSDSVFLQKPNINLIDTFFCANSSIEINSGFSHAYNFLWSNLTTDSIIIINSAGQYWIQVTDTTLLACSKTDTFIVSVDNFANTASLGPDTSICSGNTISLQSGASEAIQYLWSDNSTNSTLTINTIGDYSLTVTNQRGCVATDTIHVNIHGIAPLPGFSFSNTCLGDQTMFTDTSQTLDGSNINAWQWIINNDTTITQNTSSMFNAIGTYQAQLTISTTNNCSSVITKNIVVNPKPIPNFVINGNHQGESISLVDQSTIQAGFISSWFWDFGDGNFSANTNPQHIYLLTGDYKVKLIVESNNGCKDSIIKIFHIFPPLLNPASITGLALWLNADSGTIDLNTDGFIEEWQDQSGQLNNSTQSILGTQPRKILNQLNGHSVINFDGVDDNLIGTTINQFNNKSFTFFIVAKGYPQTGVLTSYFEISGYDNGLSIGRHLNDGTAFNYFCGAVDLNGFQDMNMGFDPKIFIARKNMGNSVELKTNTSSNIISSNATLTGTFLNGNYHIGYATNWNYLNADIAEIILYDTILNTSQEYQVYQYLSLKYGARTAMFWPDSISDYSFCNHNLTAGTDYLNYQWSTGENTQSISVDSSGWFTVDVTDTIFDYVSSDSVFLQKPNINLIDTFFCVNSSIEINSGFSHAYNFLWSNLTTDSIISINSAGQYWIQVTDTSLLACSKTDTFIVSVDNFAITASLGPDTSICSGNNISLYSGASEAIQYLWSDNTTNNTLTINSIGDYSITVTNQRGCVASDTIHVNIHGIAPLPGFSYSNTCLGDITMFTDTSQTLDGSNINNWQWIINNDTTTTQNTSNIFNNIGNYQVMLIVTTDSNCLNSVSKNITIHPNPLVDYSVAGTCMGGTSYFTNLSSVSQGYLQNMNWSFGDNNNSILLNPQHTFSDIGFYQVQLIATSNEGCKDTITKNIEIKHSPIANFDFSPACTGSATWFFDLTQTLPIFPITIWNWQFGDGDSSLQQNPQHIYNSVGQYPVKLIINSLNGCADTLVSLVSVSAPPVAGFIGDSTCLGLPINFLDTSFATNGNIYKWHWNFGNGTSSSISNPSVDYANTGNYAVNLKVTSSVDCIDEITKIIKVFPLPVPNFSCLPNLGAPPLSVNFENSTSNELSFWNFGDGEFSILNSPIHVFNNIGDYTIWLKSENSHGCIDSIFRTVKVVPNIHNLAILSIDYSINSNYLTASTVIANMGTMPIIRPLLTLSTDKSTPVMEVYSDTIFSSETVNYTFSAQLPFSENNQPSYVCVKGILPPGITDNDYTNNESCKTNNTNNLILNIYPNPTNSEINLDLNVIIPGNSTLDIFDKEGRFVYSNQIVLEASFNRIKIDVKNFSKGKYTIRLISQESENSAEFIKY